MSAKMPESQSRVLEDDVESLLPQVEETEEEIEYVNVTEQAEKIAEAKPEVKKEEKPAKQQKATQKQEEVTEELPENLRGKTPVELAKMYSEAQKLIGRQGQELGDLRSKADQYIRASLEEAALRKAKQEEKTAPAAAEEMDDSEFFAKPKDAISKLIENHPTIKQIRETLGKSAEDREVSRVTEATERFNEAHPDAGEILNTPEFREWVQASRVRTALLKQAHERFDFEAGDEVFSTWKALKGAGQAKVAAEEKAETDAAAAASAAAATLAKRKQELKAAKTPTGGNPAAATNTGAKKIYRRADVLRLMEQDPNRYEQLASEIELAYKEGRVR